MSAVDNALRHSVLIDYLEGCETAVEYMEAHLDEWAVVPPLTLFEVHQDRERNGW